MTWLGSPAATGSGTRCGGGGTPAAPPPPPGGGAHTAPPLPQAPERSHDAERANEGGGHSGRSMSQPPSDPLDGGRAPPPAAAAAAVAVPGRPQLEERDAVERERPPTAGSSGAIAPPRG